MSRRLVLWQALTLAVLFIGYVGYYICRSNLSVASTLIIKEHEAQGFTKETIGLIVSLGMVGYAIGKLTGGPITDSIGGKAVFLLGMIASAICTVSLGIASGFMFLALFWILNRYFQALGWGALLKIVARWFSPRRQATAMGILSMSYLWGDAFARFYLGYLLSAGFTWRSLFLAAAATLFALAAIAWLLLRASPREIGEPEPADSEVTVFQNAAADADTPLPLGELLLPLLASPAFWTVCILNFGLTMIRESFNQWTPTYLEQHVGLATDQAAINSLYFPLAGGAAVVCGGLLSDSVGGPRGRIVAPSLFLLVIALSALCYLPTEGQPVLAIGLISMVAFFLMAPYSFLAGVIALDIGGKRGSSTTANLVDAAGYVGGIFSGWGFAKLTTIFGWQAAFIAMAVVAAVTALVAATAWLVSERRARANG